MRHLILSAAIPALLMGACATAPVTGADEIVVSTNDSPPPHFPRDLTPAGVAAADDHLALEQVDGAEAQAFVAELFKHVPVLDTGARGATTTFTQRGIGDVFLSWENEAFLALKEFGEDKFDIVVPSLSILAEPPVAIVEGNVDAKGTRAEAQAYLDFLYTPKGQAIIAKHYYRPRNPEAADPKDIARFPKVELVTIDESFGGWAKAQPAHFGDGGTFDQLYKPAR